MGSVEIKKIESYTVMNIPARLTIENLIPVKECLKSLRDAGDFFVVVNLSQVTEITSSGIGMFIQYSREFERENGALVLSCLSDQARTVLEILHLLKFFNIFNSDQDAVTYLKTLN